MSLSLQEAIDKLFSGKELKWSHHQGHDGGSVLLETPGARRLFAYLLLQPAEKVVNCDEEIFPGLIDAWENEDYDPSADKAEPAVTTPTSAFHLDRIETEGFGGLNLFGGPPFVMVVDCESWCLEGQNGSGKTSLASAIVWALTSRRIREQVGPIIDKGSREPVFDDDNNEIGFWPPLAAYPPIPDDLEKDARVWVRLTFRNEFGSEAIAEREIVSKKDGSIEIVKEEVDERLRAGSCRKVGGKLENWRKLLIVKPTERRCGAAERSLRHGTSYSIDVATSIFR
ncbi:MAG: AAA family ATPase [Proteobacteria bacterium]|nr:AAA family ATPase [Pseudomonadota bacterium]